MSNSIIRQSNNLQMPWFHGSVTRDETERLLTNCSNGTFLIRNSTNFPGNFTLCVSYKGKVEHYRIYLKNYQYSCDNEEFFDNLTQLVSHYKREADGLCHRLIAPLVSEEYKIYCETSNNKKDVKEFEKANLLVSKSELTFGEIIGHGEFGDVLLGFYKETKVAIKTLKNGLVDDLLKEARFMINLNHTHLVSLVGVIMESNHGAYILTEYMANGNLVDYLRSRGRHSVDKLQLIKFAENVAEGMSYIEAHNFVHRDLAARNVLLDENVIAKISDFGLAQVANQPSNKLVRGRFPIKWSAPEALRSSIFTNKSDVWSYGVLLWEIYSFGRVPYPRIPIQDVIRHIENGYRMEPPENCPPFIDSLMRKCWNINEHMRPSFSEILFSIKRYNETNESL